MFKIYSMLSRLLAWATAGVCPPDPLAALSPRDWADLPVYHPDRESDRGCLR